MMENVFTNLVLFITVWLISVKFNRLWLLNKDSAHVQRVI